MQQQVQLVNYVCSWNKSNVLGARVPLQTHLNLNLLYQLASSRSDKEVVAYLMFGWPLNHDGSPVTLTLKNHPLVDN